MIHQIICRGRGSNPTHINGAEVKSPASCSSKMTLKQSLRRLKKFGKSAKAYIKLYRCTMGSILSVCITVTHCSAADCQALVQRVVKIAEATNLLCKASSILPLYLQYDGLEKHRI